MGGFIAERDGKALGIVHWVIHHSTWNAKNICYLQDLFTTKEARGSGVGRRLIATVREWPRRRAASASTGRRMRPTCRRRRSTTRSRTSPASSSIGRRWGEAEREAQTNQRRLVLDPCRPSKGLARREPYRSETGPAPSRNVLSYPRVREADLVSIRTEMLKSSAPEQLPFRMIRDSS